MTEKILGGPVRIWGGDPDEGTMAQANACAASESAAQVCLMADNHRGYNVPIGAVVAYRNAVSPAGVGYDIACGNKAVKTNLTLSEVAPDLPGIMDAIFSNLSFGVGRNNNVKVESAVFDNDSWRIHPAKPLMQMARNQLGTIGGGNHYVDLLVDDRDDALWVACHFGSRGLGHKMATWFLEESHSSKDMDAPPVLLSTHSELGALYLEMMSLAGQYAYAGRDWVCNEAMRILGAHPVDEVHNHHNFAWRETHGGEDLWVVRKGATPSFPNQRSFVGGSMGDLCAILCGIDSGEAQLTLRSTVHGAGRVMSRTAAKGKVNRRTGEIISNGAVTPEMMDVWMRERAIVLRGGDVDESPHCYRRLADVLAAMGRSVAVETFLRPVGVAMAGAATIDPFKD